MKLLIILLGALLLGAVGGAVWDLRTGLLILLAMLAGACLGFLLSNKKVADAPHSSPALALPVSLERQREAAALEARAASLLEAMMEGMREGILVVDEDLRIVTSNRAARQMFSLKEGLRESQRLSELTRNPAIHSAFTFSLERNEQVATKVERQGASGEIFDLRVVPLQLDENNRRGAMGVFFNITRLERLERVRQEFLSNVSHELRTPLTAIIAFVETLEDGAMEDPESNRRFLYIIRKNAQRMHNLIDDILELSAIEAGTVSVSMEPIPLRALVSDVLTALSTRAAARRVTLNNEVAADTIVFADARRLEQMLTNLVDNAIKFNREEGLVTVRHERGARDRISVADTGDGIPPEHVKRIFERFYRVDRARSREMGGTGLGLAIVKHLSRAHGGDVSVQSTPGVGSTFIIELPFEGVKEAEDEQAKEQERGSTRAPIELAAS